MLNYSIETKFDASEIKPSGPARNEDVLGLMRIAEDAGEKVIQIQGAASLVYYLDRYSQDSGGYVRICKEYYFCPGLFDSNQKFVPLFSLLEVFDEVLDYDRVLNELPNLSYSKISGALSFLKKISQFNMAGIDIEQAIEEEFAPNDEFIKELREALHNQEGSRVLNFD